ncbi:MAG: NADH-ubiquinone oxidoreductase-F iron-sulfur binding region domain-containing protein, partial [Acidimicrobiales bacterium]
ETIDTRDLLVRLAAFFQHESCGQCVPCRVGTQRQLELLQSGRLDKQRLEDLAKVMGDASICGLGQTAASAIGSGIDLGFLEVSE